MPLTRDAQGRFVSAQTYSETLAVESQAGDFEKLNTAAGLPLDTEWKWFPEREDMVGGGYKPPWR